MDKTSEIVLGADATAIAYIADLDGATVSRDDVTVFEYTKWSRTIAGPASPFKILSADADEGSVRCEIAFRVTSPTSTLFADLCHAKSRETLVLLYAGRTIPIAVQFEG